MALEMNSNFCLPDAIVSVSRYCYCFSEYKLTFVAITSQSLFSITFKEIRSLNVRPLGATCQIPIW